MGHIDSIPDEDWRATDTTLQYLRRPKDLARALYRLRAGSLLSDGDWAARAGLAATAPDGTLLQGAEVLARWDDHRIIPAREDLLAVGAAFALPDATLRELLALGGYLTEAEATAYRADSGARRAEDDAARGLTPRAGR